MAMLDNDNERLLGTHENTIIMHLNKPMYKLSEPMCTCIPVRRAFT